MRMVPLLVPAGSDTEVQYNDGGLFGGDATMTFNDATKVLTVQEIAVTNDANIGNDCTVVATNTVKRLLAGGVVE